MATEADACGNCGGNARECNCAAIGEAYGRLRVAIDSFAEVTGHGLKLVIRPPRKSDWPRIEMTIGAKP